MAYLLTLLLKFAGKPYWWLPLFLRGVGKLPRPLQISLLMLFLVAHILYRAEIKGAEGDRGADAGADSSNAN